MSYYNNEYYSDSEDDGMFTTAREAGRPVAARARKPKAAPVEGDQVTVVSGRGAMRGYSGQAGTIKTISSMGIVVRFADGMTRTARPNEVQA